MSAEGADKDLLRQHEERGRMMGISEGRAELAMEISMGLFRNKRIPSFITRQELMNLGIPETTLKAAQSLVEKERAAAQDIRLKTSKKRSEPDR